MKEQRQDIVTKEPSDLRKNPLETLVMCFERYRRATKRFGSIEWSDEDLAKYDEDVLFLKQKYRQNRVVMGFEKAENYAHTELFKKILSENT